MRSRGCAPTWRGRCRRAGAGFRASSCAPTASSRSRCARRRRASRPSWRGSPTSPTPAATRGARAPTSSGSPPCASARRRTAPARRCIADADGRLLEGAFTSLLWWEGETLCAVPDDAPILPGITRALLLELARERGTPVAQRRPRAARAGRPRDVAGQRAARDPRGDALGERRSAGRWRTARGRLAAAARRPDGPSGRLSRATSGARSRTSGTPLRANGTSAGIRCGRAARAYDPAGSKGEQSGPFR